MRVKQTLGTQVRRLLELTDGGVAALYADAGLDYRPRFTPVMRPLLQQGAMTVGELAQVSGLTQPAISQTVGQMARAGLVENVRDADRRVRRITLSARGETLRQPLERQWAATTLVTAQLDAELPMPLSDLLAEAIERLEADPIASRIRRATTPPKG